jgi:hypothetical protein
VTIIHGFWIGWIWILGLLIEGIRQKYFPRFGFESRHRMMHADLESRLKNMDTDYELFVSLGKTSLKFFVILLIFVHIFVNIFRFFFIPMLEK